MRLTLSICVIASVSDISPCSVVAHTVSGSSWWRLRFNGVEVGETGINAALCGTWGCPVVLVTGDEASCREGTALLGDGLTTVAVKKGLGRFSARQVPAPKAQLWGLVEYVVDTLDEGIEQFGGGLASLSPNALRELRQLLRDTQDAPSFERELEAFTRCLEHPDGREGVAAFLEKRAPRWRGR